MSDNCCKPILSTKLMDIKDLFINFRHDRKNIYVNNGGNYEKEHFHNFCEIYINISGNVQFMVENNVFDICKGDIILIKPNIFHQCLFKSDCVHEHICIWMESFDLSSPIKFFHEQNFNHVISFPDNIKDEFLSLCFLFEEIKDDPNQKIKSLSVFLNIISIIEAHISTSVKKEISLPQIVLDSLNYINENFKSISTIQEVTDKFFISQSTLERNYKKHLNISPKRYLILRKLLHSKQLLEQGCSVTKACFDSGFNDCSYFTYVFKKHFNTTPKKAKSQTLL